jgi:hypothetical protein
MEMRRALAVVGVWGLCVLADAQQRTLYWERIDVTATVNKDSTVDVVEKQEYVFTGAWNGGYRDLVLQQVDHYSDIEVWEGNSRYTQGSVAHRGGFILEHPDSRTTRVKWRSREASDPPYGNTHVIFTVKYKVHGALGQGSHEGDREYDELHWKMIFADRSGVVKHATATVILPQQFAQQQVAARVYGPSSSPTARIREDGAIYAEAEDLPPGVEMVMQVRFPAGVVQRSASEARALNGRTAAASSSATGRNTTPWQLPAGVVWAAVAVLLAVVLAVAMLLFLLIRHDVRRAA